MTADRGATFGSAHLYVHRMPPEQARALLEAAADAGCTRLDTAPLYGWGRSESLVGQVAAAHGLAVTTKVGLEPAREPPRWREALSGRLQALPFGLVERLRGWRARPAGVAGSGSGGPTGRFATATVGASIERSLARLGPIDRLLLHEVHPADIDDPLLEFLDGYRRRGDVRRFGVATANPLTAAALARSQGLFTVAHVSVDPLQPVPVTHIEGFGTGPVRWVGHGALGAGGRTLAALAQRLAPSATAWRQAVADTELDAPDGLALALVARAAAIRAVEPLVATRRIAAVERTVRAAAGRIDVPPAVRALIDAAVHDAVRSGSSILDRGLPPGSP